MIEELDVESSIYELPIMLRRENLDDLVVENLHLDIPARPMTEWNDVVRRLKSPSRRVDIGVVGKYIELQDAYKSVYESLTHGGIQNDCAVNVQRIDAEDLEDENGVRRLRGLDAILVPGGFGDRGVEGKIIATRFAREEGIPFFGLCLGMQIAVIEFARNVLQLSRANSVEFDPETPDPVIALMEDQKGIRDLGGSMRLGAYSCQLKAGSLAQRAYGKELVSERHRHRYEFNNAYIERVEEAGMIVSGLNPDRELVEIVELKDHPWFLAVQFHPEFQSKPNRAHPLFADFIRTALELSEKRAGEGAVRARS